MYIFKSKKTEKKQKKTSFSSKSSTVLTYQSNMSSIPGFNGGDNIEESSSQPIEIEIPYKAEWRFEVPFKTIMKLTVLEGTGEIFGTELPSNVQVQFSGVKYSVYSPLPDGCKISYFSVPNKENYNISSEDGEISEYISEETPMEQYLNLHFALELYRQQATLSNLDNSNIDQQTSRKLGPKVLIVGNQQSGKTTLAKILSSYAYKMDRVPILVNLNPQDGCFALPGSITSTPISDSFDLQSINGWGSTLTSGTTIHNPKQPLVKNYGFTKIQENLELYKYQVSKLGVATLSRLEDDLSIKNSGLIIDTPGLSSKDDFLVIENIVSDFEVDIIVVIGNERLSIDLRKKFKHKLASSHLEILKVHKSGGVVELEDSFIRKTQEDTIKEYFNGDYRIPLSPFKTEIELKNFVFYKPVELLEYMSSLAFLPAGDSFTPETSEASEVKKEDNALTKYYNELTEKTSSNLENSIIAITQVSDNNKSPRDLLNTCVLGYAHISKVDETKGKAKILLPFPGAFPKNILISTNVKYAE